jgi:hypothetical protein
MVAGLDHVHALDAALESQALADRQAMPAPDGRIRVQAVVDVDDADLPAALTQRGGGMQQDVGVEAAAVGDLEAAVWPQTELVAQYASQRGG